MKGFALGLTLKQRQKATRTLPTLYGVPERGLMHWEGGGERGDSP